MSLIGGELEETRRLAVVFLQHVSQPLAARPRAVRFVQ
jgi:hypothetical protein